MEPHRRTPLWTEKTILKTPYSLETLPNGLRVVTIEMPQLHSVELVAYVAVGGRHEPAHLAGISHFLEHMIFRGAGRWPDSFALERAFEEIGGSVNAATDMETTSFFSRVHPDHLERGVELLSAMLQHPQMNGLEIERRIIQEEALEDLNEKGQDINPDNLAAGLMYPEHPLGQPLIGTAETMAAIDMAALTAYHQQHYVPDQVVVAAAGRVEPARLRAAAMQWLGGWQGSAKIEPVLEPPFTLSGPQSVWVEDSSSQLALQLAYRLPGRNHADAMALRLLRRILSWGGNSRLMRRLREELGLTYAVEADLLLYADCGSLAIDLSITPEKLYPALQEILRLIADVCTTPVGQEEMHAVIQGYRYDLEFSCDLPEEMASRYGWGTLADCRKTVEDDLQAISQVTSAQVLQAAQRWLSPQQSVLVVVGPWQPDDRTRCDALIGCASTESGA